MTLLAWAEYLGVAPQPPNRYFEAKAAGALPRVESARRRTIVVTPHRPVLLFNAAFSIAAVVIASLVVATDPGQLLRPFGLWTPLILLGVSVTTLMIWALVMVLAEDRLRGNWNAFVTVPEGDECAHVFYYYLTNRVNNYALKLIPFFVIPIAVPVAPLPLMPRSLTAYFVISITCGLLYWVPAVEGFGCGRRYYLYRPSPYIDMYDDPRCRHWVVVTRQSGAPRQAATAEPVETLSARVS